MSQEFIISPDDRGRWTVSRGEGGPALGDQAFRNWQEAYDNLRTVLASEGLAVSQLHQEGLRMRVSTREAFGPSRPDITLRLTAMPELAKLIDHLSSKLGMPAAETIAQALVMLKIAVDAGSEGKRLAIIDDELNVEREILIPGRPHVDA